MIRNVKESIYLAEFDCFYRINKSVRLQATIHMTSVSMLCSYSYANECTGANNRACMIDIFMSMLCDEFSDELMCGGYANEQG